MNSTNNRMLVKNCLASALGLLVCLFRYLTDKSTYLNDSFFFLKKKIELFMEQTNQWCQPSVKPCYMSFQSIKENVAQFEVNDCFRSTQH